MSRLVSSLGAAAVFGALALGVAPASDVRAATLRTPDGLAVEIRPGRRLEAPPGSPLVAERGGGLAYAVVDALHREWRGIVPGSRELGDRPAPALASHPLTRDVLLVAVDEGTEWEAPRLVLSSWTGQGWTELEPLGEAFDGYEPAFTIRQNGDALLLWREPLTYGGRLFLLNAEMGPAGVAHVLSFSDLGDPRGHLPVSHVLLPREGLNTWLIAETGTDRVWVVLDDPVDGGSAVLSVDVTVLDDGNGGLGAAPVPVTFTRVLATEPSPGDIGGPALGSNGTSLMSQRLIGPSGAEALYWLEGDELIVVSLPAVDGEAGVLEAHVVPAPAVPELAPVVAWRQLRRAEAGAEPADRPRERSRRR